jgi:hypothetical protein
MNQVRGETGFSQPNARSDLTYFQRSIARVARGLENPRRLPIFAM